MNDSDGFFNVWNAFYYCDLSNVIIIKCQKFYSRILLCLFRQLGGEYIVNIGMGPRYDMDTYQLANPLMGGAGGNSYDYWLDQTSKLYYRTISPAQYRESLNAFFGAGNDGTIDCIVGNLQSAPTQ